MTTKAQKLRRQRLGARLPGLSYGRLAGHFIDTNQYLELTDSTVTPPREYRYASTHGNITSGQVAAIKAQHGPWLDLLAYQNFGAMIIGPHGDIPTSLVSFEEAVTHGEADSWFLHAPTKAVSGVAAGSPPVWTTSTAHDLSLTFGDPATPDWVAISGSSVSGYNGIWEVKTLPTSTTATFRNQAGTDMPNLGAATGGTLAKLGRYCDFTYLFWANLSRASYWTQAANHLAALKGKGFRGILLDDVNPQPGHCWTDGMFSEYAAEANYRSAVAAGMATVAASIRAQDLLVVPNIGMDPWNSGPYSGYTSMLSAKSFDVGLCEFWTNWRGILNDPPFTGATWVDKMKLLTDADAAGVRMIANTYQLNPVDHFRALDYGLASFYLHWNGVADSTFSYNHGRPTSIYSQYRAAIGAPLGPKQLVAGTAPNDGAWMRYYTGGVACANARSTAGSVTFTPGGSWKDSTGATVTQVVLAPGYGAVLLNPTIA
jgi:hypothetical protein